MTDLTFPEVEIDLNGEIITLKCTLEAATRINTHFAGFGKAYDRVVQMDLDAYVALIRHGAGLDANAAKELPPRIFRAGLANLTGPLSRYVALLISGGRASGADEPGEAGRGGAAST